MIDSKFYELVPYWSLVAIISSFKLLNLNLKSYRSTDFEVHRNWLAITHSLPLKDWYYENTSEWTLDYPPFFAYFELMLSYIAKYFDENMLNVKNLNYASEETIFFQRFSVVIVDLILAYGILDSVKSLKSILNIKTSSKQLSINLLLLIFANSGLFIVDQIHFQYNGFLFGVLILSISRIIKGKYFQGALLFAILLNLKHIFLYVAPAFGIYLFSRYCLKRDKNRLLPKLSILNLMAFGIIVSSVFAISFGPFYKHIPQILKRLFPFKRGLSHAYWAPNFWALYNTIDLGLNFVFGSEKSAITGGLIGDHSLTNLPQVEPLHTFILTLLFMAPSLIKLLRRPTELNFIKVIILTAWTSFMFGYHVHEKAILNVIIPFGLISFKEPKIFTLLLIPATVSLFPLLFTPFEILTKLFLALLHIGIVFPVLNFQLNSLMWFEKLYLFGLFPVYMIENFGISFFTFFQRFPFLPLIIVSDYCFVGIFYCYIYFYTKFLMNGSDESEKRKNE